jgi:hypothetical protein
VQQSLSDPSQMTALQPSASMIPNNSTNSSEGQTSEASETRSDISESNEDWLEGLIEVADLSLPASSPTIPVELSSTLPDNMRKNLPDDMSTNLHNDNIYQSIPTVGLHYSLLEAHDKINAAWNQHTAIQPQPTDRNEDVNTLANSDQMGAASLSSTCRNFCHRPIDITAGPRRYTMHTTADIRNDITSNKRVRVEEPVSNLS